MGGPQAGTNNGYLLPGRTGGRRWPLHPRRSIQAPPLLTLLQHPRGRAPPSLGLGWSVTQPALPQAPSPKSILEEGNVGRTGGGNEDEHLALVAAAMTDV